MSATVVVDYGVGNLLSVTRALDCVGAEVILTSSPSKIANADRLVLPGVGAFGNCMAGLSGCGLIDPVKEFATKGRPFLGICVGMQMMLALGEEFGTYAGLGLVPGRVAPLPANGEDGSPHKIPHIGWSQLLQPAGRNWKGTILSGLPDAAAVYFVHSFMALPESQDHRLADCDYNGIRIAATIAVGSLYGCQFHPEKSGPVGLRIIENFIRL